MKIYTVSEITKEIKLLLEDIFPSICVEGELSNLRTPESGHIYFSLKDEFSQIRCVMFRSAALTLRTGLLNGMKIRVFGKIGLYERDGNYQLYADKIEPAGMGDLAIKFEQLKKKLRDEGLFDEARKRRLPSFPESLGIITSATGAAIRDIIKVARRRWPSCMLVLNPVRVQGTGAADEIAQAIDEFNDFGGVELLLVGRGGGSMEDLWPFNEETVARAIQRSRIPIVSAVGHEIDFTISDFVADVRAATPSGAVEQILPDRTELGVQIESIIRRAEENLIGRVERLRERLRSVQLSYGFRRPIDILTQRNQSVDELEKRADKSIRHLLEVQRSNAQALTSRLESLNPHRILARGYSISRKLPEGNVLKDSRDVKTGDTVEVRLHKGVINTEVTRKEA